MDDIDDCFEDEDDVDIGGQLLEEQMFEDIAMWHQRREAAKQTGQHVQKDRSVPLGLSSDSDSHNHADNRAISYRSAGQAAGQGSKLLHNNASCCSKDGLPQISKLLHDNPSCCSGKHGKGELWLCHCARSKCAACVRRVCQGGVLCWC
jgi:hypothetical protein